MSRKEKYLTRLVEACFDCSVSDYTRAGGYDHIFCTVPNIKEQINVHVYRPYKSSKVRIQFYTWYDWPDCRYGFTEEQFNKVQQYLNGQVMFFHDGRQMIFDVDTYPWS